MPNSGSKPHEIIPADSVTDAEFEPEERPSLRMRRLAEVAPEDTGYAGLEGYWPNLVGTLSALSLVLLGFWLMLDDLRSSSRRSEERLDRISEKQDMRAEADRVRSEEREKQWWTERRSERADQLKHGSEAVDVMRSLKTATDGNTDAIRELTRSMKPQSFKTKAPAIGPADSMTPQPREKAG